MTGANPILESLEHEWDASRRWTAAHFHPHHDQADELRAANPAIGRTVSETAVVAALAPQTPATRPVNLAAATAAAVPKENRMSIATLEDDVKADLTDGMAWLEGMVARVKAAAPGIIATSDALASSTVGRVAEMFLGKVLPPDVEQELLSIVKRYVTTFGQPAQAPAAPQPVPAGQ